MSIYNTWFYKAYVKVLSFFAEINWNFIKEKITGCRHYDLTDEDLQLFRDALATNYYIIAIRRKTYMSTYLIGFASFVKTGKAGHYCHVALNLEGDNPETDNDYQLYESTGSGVHLGTFMDIFNCDSVCLLRPTNVSVREWEGAVDVAKAAVGKEYDNWFNVNDDTCLSCVELVRNALRALPDYETKFANFESEIQRIGNLTPQMFVDSPDFTKVIEIRR